MGDLTRNFSLAEFTRSATAREIGDDNAPTPAHRKNLERLAKGMEKVRDICGDRAVTITSGYRNPRVNRAVGGVANSDHASGHAADFTVKGLTARQVCILIRDSELEFDQLILETSRGVTHLSFAPRMRRQVLTQAKGPGTPVSVGIE